MLALLTAYATMALVQSRGADIIGMLWGDDARTAALAQNTDAVQPDADVAVLCGGYDLAHFDVTSNILHAAGMLATVYLGVRVVLSVMGALTGTSPSLSTLFQLALWMPPVYYLPAWFGHLWLQKDIPAVFTYGTTVRGWAVGEYCAFVDLAAGGVVQEPVAELVPTALGTLLLIAGIESLSSTSAASGTTKTKKKLA